MVNVPPECDPGHVYHLFVIRTRRRDDLRAALTERGIETLIHYPVPIPRQPALAGTEPADYSVAAQVCDEILSLPLHPGLSDDDAGYVTDMLSKGCDECVH